MRNCIQKLISTFIVMTTILVSSITYIKPVEIKAEPYDVPEQAVAYLWQSAEAKVPMLFYSMDSALGWAEDGYTIYMNQDWKISNPITIPSGKIYKIEMNGHKIYRELSTSVDNGGLLTLASGATLYLLGNGDPRTGVDVSEHEFTYQGYNEYNYTSTNTKYTLTVKAGGLVTGGYSDVTAGAIYMNSNSNLYLTNVAVNGNASDNSLANGAIHVNGENCYIEMDKGHIDHNYSYSSGGAIRVDANNCHVVMKNQSTINYNQTSISESDFHGAAIAVKANNFVLDMDNSSIDYNHTSNSNGSAFYTNKSAKINMKNGSTMNYNLNNKSGGAIFVDEGSLTLTGDKKSEISHNQSSFGGGIYLGVDSEGSTIQGINFNDNQAGTRGGAIYIESKDNEIKECTMQENHTITGNGGTIFVKEDYNEIRDCTIKNNYIEGLEGQPPGYGAGIYVDSKVDIYMYGKNIVENNIDSKGDYDDVYLDTTTVIFSFYDAYIKGSADEGSHIGLRSSSSSKNKLGVDITDYIEGTYFLDDASNLHLVYYSDDKELYQEKGESTKYTLTVNGAEVGKYYAGESVKIVDRNDDYEQVFMEWNTSETTGITITEEQKEMQIFTITMPSNDVKTSAKYLERIKSLTLNLANKPTAGSQLSDELVTVKYSPKYGGETESRTKNVEKEWLKVDGTTMTPVTGIADYSTSYVFKIQMRMDPTAHLIFSSKITADDITIAYGDELTTKASSVTVDSSGTITIISEPITTANRVITSIEPDSITVNEGITKDELIASLPATAIGSDSSNKQYVLTVGNIIDDMISSLISDGKVIYPTDGSAVVTLPVTAPQGFDIATGIVFNVTVNVNALPTIESITDAYMTVKDGTSSTDFISELPGYAEVLASDESVKFLEVNTDSLGTQLDAYLTDGKIDINKGTAFDIYLTVNTDGTVKNPENKTLKVTVTVNDKDTVDVPTVTPASGTYKEQLVDGNLNVTVSYGDGEDIVKGDTIHYIVDNNKDDEKTCSLDEEHTSCTITLEGTANTKVTHTLEVWASATDKNDSTHIRNSYVLDNSIEVTTPTVDTASGNYSGTSLTVHATTDQTEAKIYYIIDNGDPIEYDSTKGIELTTEKDVARTFNIKVWAEVSGVSSEVVERTYILDGYVEPDKYNVTIICTDTAIVKPDEKAWRYEIIQSYDKNTKVIISAPSYEDQGKVFEKWIYTNEEGQTVESTEPTLTFTSLNSDKQVKAIYNPVITEINFNIPYPEAGKALATKDDISAIATVAKVAGKDIKAYFDLENMSWLPNDTTADYETSYTLSLPIIHNISNVRYVLADGIKVTVNGNADIAANIDEEKLIAYITFPKTDIHRYNLKSIEQPEDITLSYAEAYKLQTEQEEESKKEDPQNLWNLPKETNLILDDDSKLSTSITWNIPQFNKESWSEQTIEVEGTVKIPSNVIQGEVSNKVTLKIHVEAPVQVSTPTSSIPTGTYKDTQLVTLKSNTENDKIYYTLDGTEPTTDSTLYEGSFKVKDTTTIKAIAVYSGMIDSDVSTYTITIDRTPDPTPTTEPKKSSGWDDGGPFTTDSCGNVYDRWGNKIYEATSCNVGGYNLVGTDTKD